MAFNPPVNITGRDGNRANVGIFGGLQVESLQDYVSVHFSLGFSVYEVITETTGDGSVVESESMAVLSGNTGTASIQSRQHVRYRPGHTFMAGGTVLFDGAGIGRIGVHDGVDGFWIQYDTSTDVLSVVRTFDGVDTVQVVDQTRLRHIDWRRLNIWRIRFGYYGIAPVIFEVLRPGTLNYDNVHTFYLHGIASKPHIAMPLLPVRVEAGAGAVVKTASLQAGTLGGSENLGARIFSNVGSKNFLDNADEQFFILFRNLEIFNGRLNPITARLLFLNFASDIDGIVVVSFKRDPVISNAPTWIPVDTGNSVVEYSGDATFSDYGRQVASFFIAGGQKISTAESTDYSRIGLQLRPSEQMAITVQRLSGTVSFSIYQSMTWEELF